jgi:hypothetical protein
VRRASIEGLRVALDDLRDLLFARFPRYDVYVLVGEAAGTAPTCGG